MRKILLCTTQKSSDENEGKLKLLWNFLNDKEKATKRIDPLNAFKKTYAYNQLSEECKDNLDKYLGYEYESELDAKEALQNLMYYFEDSNNEKIEVKVARAKNGNKCKVVIFDKKHSHSEEVNFEISEKFSASPFRWSTVFSICMLSIFLSIFVMNILGFNIEEQKPTINDIPNYLCIFIVAFTVLAFIYCGCFKAFSQLKKLYSFEGNFSLALILVVIAFEFYFCSSERIAIGCVIALIGMIFCGFNAKNGLTFDRAVKGILVVVTAPITKTIGSLLFKIKG